MTLAKEGGRGHQPIHIGKDLLHNAHKYAIAGIAASAIFVGGAAVDRQFFNNDTKIEINSSIMNLPTVASGQILSPLSESAREGTDGNFAFDESRIIHTQEELDQTLLRIRDPKTLKPIDYDFDPSREVVVIAALGAGERPASDSIRIETATEKDGVLNITIVREQQFTHIGGHDDTETVINSPYAIAKFPRVREGDREATYQIGTPKIVLNTETSSLDK